MLQNCFKLDFFNTIRQKRPLDFQLRMEHLVVW